MSMTASWIDPSLVEALGWVLAHFSRPGALIALVVPAGGGVWCWRDVPVRRPGTLGRLASEDGPDGKETTEEVAAY